MDRRRHPGPVLMTDHPLAWCAYLARTISLALHDPPEHAHRRLEHALHQFTGSDTCTAELAIRLAAKPSDREEHHAHARHR